MFEETDLPDCVKADIYEEREHTIRDNVFHVSELSYTCMYKQYLDRLEGKDFNDDAYWNIYRGRVFDKRLTALFDENELRVQHRVKGTPYIIRGRIDGYNYDTNSIYEIKTVASIKFVRAPYKHHIPQGIFYLNTFDPLANLHFLYVSMDGWKNFKYTGDIETAGMFIEDFEDKARVLGKALRTGDPPEPIKGGGECNWCRYRQEGKCPVMKPKKSRGRK